MKRRYCKQCGNDEHGDTPCDPIALKAMRLNPLLALLLKEDGTMNEDAPIILGGGSDV